MNYKRKRPRTRVRTRKGRGYWMHGWPAWWDIVFHRRPRRRRDQERLRAIFAGHLDPDNASFELGNHKPHRYFW
jgi:hypothetical protein